MPRHEARRAGADAPAHRRVGGRLLHARVVGEAEVVVRAQQQDGLAVEHDVRALRPAHQPRAAIQAEVLELASRAWISVIVLVPPRCQPRRAGVAFGAPSGRSRDVALAREAQLGRRIPEPHLEAGERGRDVARRLGGAGVSPSSQPLRLSGRGLAPLSGWRATFRPRFSNIARSSSGVLPSVVRKLPIITPLMPGADRELLQLADVLHAPAAEPKQRVGQDQAEDRDPLHGLPRVHVLAVAELRAGARVEQVDRHRGRVDRGQLEGHLDALLARLAEVEDAADARLQAGLADGVDRAQAALVADGLRDLGVVGLGRLDVVVHALHAGVLQRLARAPATCARSTRSA